MTDTLKLAKTQRTSAGLRDALFDELDSLRSNQSDPKRAMAVAKLAQQIVNTVDIELRVLQASGEIFDEAPALMQTPTLALTDAPNDDK